MTKIKFDKFLYSLPAIKKAIQDYKGLADFFCQEKRDYVLVGIRNIRAKELSPLFEQEFSNYVLSLTGALK